MKIKLLTFLFLLNHFSFSQTPGEWTWIKGNSALNGLGVFGTQGVSNISNNPPSFYEACEWVDMQGNFWIFGGICNSNLMSDLWKYEPATNRWTWMKGPGQFAYNDPGNYGVQGVSSPLNYPPGRNAGATWTDTNGNLWLFGGGTYFFSSRNDLWKYNIATNEWTWMKGGTTTSGFATYGLLGVAAAANTPGPRSELATSWIDSNGSLWLFGGFGVDNTGFTGCLNDIWKYDPSSNNWTWINGSQLSGVTPTYGIQGTASAFYNPGGRFCYSKWKDTSGRFWIFGGSTDNNAPNHYNDLWVYDPVINQWAWMNGSSIHNQPSTQSGFCSFDDANSPAARYENRACWTDTCGNFWMFGGDLNSSLTSGFSDLWAYKPTTNQWALIKGPTAIGMSPTRGTMGVSSALNIPGARAGSNAFMGHNGYLYLFGGGVNLPLAYDDVWRYVPDPACVACNIISVQANFDADTVICELGCVNFTNFSVNGTSYLWSFPGGTPSSSTAASPQSICYNLPGMYDVTLIAYNGGVSDTLFLPAYIHAYAAPARPVVIRSGDTLFTTLPYASYQWNFANLPLVGATDSFYVALVDGLYSVTIVDEHGCEVSSINYDINIVGISELDLFAESLYVYYNPSTSEENISITSLKNTKASLELIDVLGRTIVQKEITLEEGLNSFVLKDSETSAGVYFVRISTSHNQLSKKFLITR